MTTGQDGRTGCCAVMEQGRIRLGVDNQILLVRGALLRLDTCADDHVALAVQCDEALANLGSNEANLVLSWIDSNHAVVLQLLLALASISDLSKVALPALVRVNYRNLSVQQVGKDVGLEGDSSTQRVMTVNDEQQDRIIVGQVRHSEGAGIGIANLELQLVSCKKRRGEVTAHLVLHGHLCQLLMATEDIKGIFVWVRIADTQSVLELLMVLHASFQVLAVVGVVVYIMGQAMDEGNHGDKCDCQGRCKGRHI